MTNPEAPPTPSIILASGSVHRARLLRDAGVPFEVIRPLVDEETARISLAAEGRTALDAATVLAELKAIHISQTNPDRLVLASDQIMHCGGVWYGKAEDRDALKQTLKTLSGSTHHLATAAVLFHGGQRIWHAGAQPALTMRSLSEASLDSYLAAAGEDILSCVGGYQIEGLGVQLFSAIEGDLFSIQGLPLLPLLDILRLHKVLPQ
ncbi:MAG: Maf family protein [Rhodospirillaceae bacterium]